MTRILFSLAMLLTASLAHAVSSEFSLLLDLDGDAATGCEVITPDGVFSGADAILTTYVETDGLDTAMVTGVERRDCIDPDSDTFGAPQIVSAGGWDVGIGNGEAGFNVIETFMPVSLATTYNIVRIGVIASDELDNTSYMLFSMPDSGNPILLSSHQQPHALPIFGTFTLLLLAVLLLAIGIIVISRRGRLTLTALACLGASTVAGACVLDGEIFNWNMADRLAQSAAIDPDNGVDVRALFGKYTNGNTQLCFRIDAALVFSTAPVAEDDAYEVIEGEVLNLGTPGVLTNDAGEPIPEVISFGGGDVGGTVDDNTADTTVNLVPDGTLTINADGSLAFEPPSGVTGDFVVFYRIENDAGTDTGQITITITEPAVNTPPVVVPPTNVAVQRHIGIVIPEAHAANLLANVTDADGPGAEPFTLTTVTDAATTNGGRVTTLANGSWNYDPPASNTIAVDSFDYQVCDSGVPLPSLCTTATATIALSGPAIWFVDASAPVGGDGTYTQPLQTLAEATAAAGVNGRIFTYSGNYTGGITLLDGQQLIGQGAIDASFDDLFGITPPAYTVARPTIGGARPLLTTVGGSVHGITLGSGNTLRGIEVGNTSGTGLHGANVGALGLGENRISGNGQALNLANGTISQVGPGTAFDQITSASGASNIVLSAIAGSANLGTGALSGAADTAFVFNTGTANITYAGTISKTTAGRLIDINGAGAASVTLSGNLSCTASCGSGATHVGIRVDGRTGGTYIFSGATKTVSSSGINHGIALINNTVGSAIRFDNGGLAVTTTSGIPFHAASGGTVSVGTGANPNTLVVSSGIALNIVNTTIAAADLSFRSITASGSSSGIVLNNTGSAGSLVVTGNGGTCTTAVNCTGGAIQNMTSHGIWLESTTEPTLSNIFINNAAAHGIGGTEVNGFSLTNSVISNTGSDGVARRANIGFNVVADGTERNLYGAVTITGNTLTNSRGFGVEAFNYNGTISSANISDNTLTSTTSPATSNGWAISLIAYGSPGTVAHVTQANIDNNVITNFPGGGGIQAQGGNSSAAGSAGTFGVPGHGTNIISITGNRVAGESIANRMGAEAIVASVGGHGQGNFNISNNGTVANPLTNVTGIGISNSTFGNAVVTSTINNNVITPNNSFGSQGIGGGLAPTFGVGDTPLMTVTVSNNTISQTDGNGILLVARDTNGTLNARVLNNMVAGPLTGVRQGIRIDSGNGGVGENDTVCLNIAGNTSSHSAGFPGALGIGLRKQGTDPGVFGFGIHGMAATGTPGVEAYVNGLNPAGGGTLLISAESGFTNCNLP